MDTKRVFLIVLDSLGIGEMPDSAAFGDAGSNTLASIAKSEKFHTPNLQKLGFFNIDGVDCCEQAAAPQASYGRFAELSKGKDTTVGHWEIAGVVSPRPLPTYPEGFPPEVIAAFEKKTGRKTLCNKPYSGTEVLKDYGEEHMRTGALIVYTSADSVFQVAAHEEIVPLEKLYEYCRAAREILQGEHGVGRVIARPFIGNPADGFTRTPHRHDFSLPPAKETVLDLVQKAGLATIGVGKIFDIFAGQGVGETHPIESNHHGMEITLELAKKDFRGFCFINLVDFDMKYGHRNDVDGYAAALTDFDRQLGELLPLLQQDDILLITADHGCDPGTPSTDHSREHVPMLIWGRGVKAGVNLGTRQGFGDMGATVAQALGVSPAGLDGTGFWDEVKI